MIFPAELYLPQKTLYDAGALSRVPDECLRLGGRGVVVYGRAFEARMDKWNAAIARSGCAGNFCMYAYKGGEPALEDVEALLSFVREKKAEFVCGIGGGSVMDLAKAGAALMFAGQPPTAYLYGRPLERAGLSGRREASPLRRRRHDDPRTV